MTKVEDFKNVDIKNEIPCVRLVGALNEYVINTADVGKINTRTMVCSLYAAKVLLTT